MTGGKSGTVNESGYALDHGHGHGTRKRNQFLDALYRNHWGELCGRLHKMFGGGSDDAEDLAQAAFAKIGAIEDIDSIRHPRAFLFRTAINIGLNAKDRAATAQSFIDDALADAGTPLLEQGSPETVFGVRQHLHRVENAMSGLTVKQRDIVIRNRIQGETFREISTATGWSIADISRQLNAALAVLQQAVDEPGYTPQGRSEIRKTGQDNEHRANRRKKRARHR